MKTSENELNDLVIKVLSHQERRRILMIVGSYPEGVKYTGILGETGLSTGRLNYPMKELEGFLDRDEDRLYSLGVLGRKAVATLNFISEGIDMGILETVNTKRADRLRRIQKQQDIGFYIITSVLIGLNILSGYLAYVTSETFLAVIAGVWALFSVFMIYMMDRFRKDGSERILWVWEWLEWKLVGNYDKK